MIPVQANPFGRLFSWRSTSRGIGLQPVRVHDIETSTDQRARRLKHLIRANHANHSIIYQDLNSFNNLDHVLGSAYLLGGSAEQLVQLYDVNCSTLEPWVDSPGEIALEDWTSFLGKREYQRAFIDFFEDQLVRFAYDWKEMLKKFMFEGDVPLIQRLTAGAAQPLIHTAYALELQSKTLAIEALSLAACCYNFRVKYFDSLPSPPSRTSGKPLSASDFLTNIQHDKRFDRLKSVQRTQGEAYLWQEHEGLMMELVSSWQPQDWTSGFQEAQKIIVGLFVNTGTQDGAYDLGLSYLVTSSHAVRTLVPEVPDQFQTALIKQWWGFSLTNYVLMGRPAVNMSSILSFNLEGKTWQDVSLQVLRDSAGSRAVNVMVTNALKSCADVWGDEDEYFLKAAVQFCTTFRQWRKSTSEE